MKSKKLLLSVAALLLLLVITLTGCSFGAKKTSDDGPSAQKDKIEQKANEFL